MQDLEIDSLCRVRLKDSSNILLGLAVKEPFRRSKTIPKDRIPLILKHSYKCKDDGDCSQANINCFNYAKDGAVEAASIRHPKATLQPKEFAIAVAKYYGKENIESKYHDDDWFSLQADIQVDVNSAKNALDYIRKAIDAEYPVVAGVNVRFRTGIGNWGEVADHFVVIIGYEIEDKNITKLKAVDPAVRGGKIIDFDIEPETYKAVKEEGKNGGVSNITSNSSYQLEQVRVWVGLKPDSQDGVGELDTKSLRRN